MVPADSRRIPRVPRYSGAASALSADFRVRGSHPLRPAFPRRSPSPDCRLPRRSYNPGARLPTRPVWAPALSLATTRAIIVIFSSSGYLDVSVPRVRPRRSPGGRRRRRPGCPIRKSALRKGYLPLGAAYRSLSRPSSPPRAKASFMCPSLLSLCLLPPPAAVSGEGAASARRTGRAAYCKLRSLCVRDTPLKTRGVPVRLSTLSLSSSSHHVSVLDATPPQEGPAVNLLRRSPWQS